MSESDESEKDSESPCCSNSLPNLVSEEDAPIIVDTITNKDGIVNIGLIKYCPTTNTQPKLMFQVKNPVHTFTGREEFLQELHDTVQKCKQEGSRVSIISQTSSISGLGGIGKTETVRMYIHKFSHEYDNVVWIDAENPSEAVSQFTTLASLKLRINVKDHKGNPREFSHILEDVYRKLCQKPKQLLIVFDNAEALDDTDTHALGIRKLLPAQTITNEPPTVLITSRQQFWEDINVITLGLWKMEECIEFIYKRLHLRDSPENKKDATELAELFDRLPIALEVAVSVIAEQLRKRKVGGSGVYSINSLIAEYKAGDRKVFLKRTQQNATQMTMQVLLNVSLKKIRAYEEGALAIRILSFMAYLSPTSIPKEMMNELINETNEDKLDTAITLLADYSLIHCYDTHFTIHRVFQDIVITTLPNLKLYSGVTHDHTVEYTDEMRVLKELISGLIKYTPKTNPTIDGYNEVVANVVHSTDYVIQNSMISQFYDFIKTFANFMSTTHCETAVKFYRALIKSDSSQTNVKKENIYYNLDSIGQIFFKNGKYAGAQETWNELLKTLVGAYIDMKQGKAEDNKEVKILDKSDKNDQEDEITESLDCAVNAGKKNVLALPQEILRTHMNIALCLSSQGKYEDALQLYYIIKTEQEKFLGTLHPDILRTKSNIAHALSAQSRSEEAMEVLNPLEKDVEKVLGRLHELTLATKMTKAITLNQQGKNHEALQLFNCLMEDEEQVFGPLHSNTLTTKMNMAAILTVQGNIEEALKINYSVEKVQEKVLGPLHPNTLTSKMNIAACLMEQGKNEEALEINYILEKNMEDALGPFHQHTLKTKMNIATCLSNLDRNDEALELYSIVEKDQEKVLGPLHPDSLLVKMRKACTIGEMGNIDEELKLYYILEKGMAKVLGPLHPDTLGITMNIGSCLAVQGKYEEAVKYFRMMENDGKEVLGLLHPLYLTCKQKMDICLEEIGKI